MVQAGLGIAPMSGFILGGWGEHAFTDELSGTTALVAFFCGLVMFIIYFFSLVGVCEYINRGNKRRDEQGTTS